MLINDLADVPDAFKTFCEVRGIVYEPEVRRDMLAASLSSQLVLFAGPSGTGKSTGARVLGEFFTDTTLVCQLDIRPMWTGPDGLTGFFSRLTAEYDEVPGLRSLLDLGASVGDKTPFIILEEANLSPMEVYLGHVLTALSGLGRETIDWRLHWEAAAVALAGGYVPSTLTVQPWPRFMATINVDSTAAAPSAKVCGRGLTVLLEPPSVDLSLASAAAIGASAITPAAPLGVSVLGDPCTAWYAFVASGHEAVLTGAIGTLCTKLRDDLEDNYVSPRDMQRCLVFMAWYVAIAEHEPGFTTIEAAAADAAELGLLHVVLPGLGGGQFSAAVDSLKKHSNAGGILDRRLDRVLSSTKGIYGAPPDFWAALA